jgi:large subunit ribosomal protein L2
VVAKAAPAKAAMPVDPWGNLTKGYRTRNNKRTQVMIVSRRKK